MTETLNLREVMDIGYELATESLKERIDAESIRDGSARWVPLPTQILVANRYEDESTGVMLTMSMSSEYAVADLSYMCASGLTYGLYAGCVDILKRRPHSYAIGDSATCRAEVGPVTIEMKLSIVDFRPKGDGTFLIYETESA